MVTNRQIYDWKKSALTAELKHKEIGFDSMRAEELYAKWSICRNVRRIILISLLALIEFLLLTSFAYSFVNSSAMAWLPGILAVVADIGFVMMWCTGYMNAADIEKHTESMIPEEIEKFNYLAHDVTFYDADYIMPRVWEALSLGLLAAIFLIIFGAIIIMAML